MWPTWSGRWGDTASSPCSLVLPVNHVMVMICCGCSEASEVLDVVNEEGFARAAGEG